MNQSPVCELCGCPRTKNKVYPRLDVEKRMCSTCKDRFETYITYGTPSENGDRYRVAYIPKGNGGKRKLEIPDSALKAEQRGLLKVLTKLYPSLASWCHGFSRGKSIATNARRHIIAGRGPDCLLKVDLKDFFPSVKWSHVLHEAARRNMPEWVYRWVLDVAYLDGRLPQGSPVSPFLANFGALKLDARLIGLTKKWKSQERFGRSVTYSRYADDLSFGSDHPKFIEILPAIKRVIEECGFMVNNDKIEFHRQPAQLRVCGIVVNKKVSVPRSYWRGLRAQIHRIRTDFGHGTPLGFVMKPESRKYVLGKINSFGLTEQIAAVAANPDNIVPIPWNEIAGKISFILSVDKRRGEQLKEEFESAKRLHNTANRYPP